jgi:uncharacterized membrane protein YjgN (DUF898 family)
MDLETTPAAPAIQAHALRFTGDGGVYMGVWLVNLLLMVVTLGLYTPFARRRTLKYFYGNTLVAGSPLEFTGGLKRMFLGFLLFFGLYLAYSIAANTEQDVAAGLLIAGWLLIAPWLWASATRFRLSSTRWRGIRFNFRGRTREAYAASLPYLGIVAMGAAVGVAGALLGDSKPASALVLAGALLALGVALYLLVRIEFNYVRLRVLRSDFGGQLGRWKPKLREFMRITAEAAGIFLAIAAALAGLIALAVSGTMAAFRGLLGQGQLAVVVMTLVFTLGAFFALYLSLSPALAYREARKFALVWDNVGLGSVARFKSSLRPWPYVRLRIKNVLLTLVTGGFYRPFAVTSEYQMKLESVTLHVKGSVDDLVGMLAQPQGAFADAVADVVGFDVVG